MAEYSTISEAAHKICQTGNCERACEGCRATVRKVLTALRLDNPDKDYPGWIEMSEGALEGEDGDIPHFWNSAIDAIIETERREFEALGMFTTSQARFAHEQSEEEEMRSFRERKRLRNQPR